MGSKKQSQQSSPPKEKPPTFVLELPLAASAGQAARLRAHLEVGRQFYNAMLSAGQRRLRCIRADPAWQEARAIPRTQRQERKAAFAALRERYGFSEYAFHELARKLRVNWIADHLDAVLAQTLASRAYHALNRVCLGKAKRVRFKSKSRGLSCLENKRNDTGMRFVLQPGADGRPHGYLLWHDDRLLALIDWDDPVVAHALGHPIKYARLVRRRASGPRAQGADREGVRYYVQLLLKGLPHHKHKHTAGTDTIGLDLGPQSIAIVPHQSEARLEPLCAELHPDARFIRRLQRKLAAHRKSLHGRLAHQLVAVGHTIITEKLSYRGWHRRYGRSVGLRAPGMLIDHLRRTGAAYGRHPTRSSHTHDQTLPILSWLRQVRPQATLTAAAPVPVRHRAGAARPVLRVSRRLSRSNARKRGRSCADRIGIPCAGARLTDQSKRTDTRAR
jgi:hypothetical protein